LQGTSGASQNKICGIGNLFSFYRLDENRWSESGASCIVLYADICAVFTDKRNTAGTLRGVPIGYCDEVAGEGSEPENCEVQVAAEFEQKKLLACFAQGIPNYCRDFQGN
jgi:hypothetical protein